MTTKRTVLVEKVRAAIYASTSIKLKIALRLNNSPYTIQRWAKDNDPYLCLPDALEIIQEEIKIPNGESYTQQVEMGDKHLAVN